LTPKPIEYQFIDTNEGDYLRLIFFGDIMLTQKDMVPRLHPEVREVINSADYFIGNCEAPVGRHDLNPTSKYGLIYHMPKLFLTGIMEQLSLTPSQWILSVANNHAGDKGKEAFFTGVEVLHDIGVTPVGQFSNYDLPISIINTQHNLKFAVAAWTHWMNCEVFSESAGAGRIEHINRAQWSAVKSHYGIDLLVGLPHWEFEFQHFPKYKTRDTARDLIENSGFDLLVGAHPHTLQPLDWFTRGICAYSLGNFCGLGLAWPVRLVPLLETHIGCKEHNKGKILGYKLHYFVQINQNDRMDILPMDAVPELLKMKLLKRLKLVFQ